MDTQKLLLFIFVFGVVPLLFIGLCVASLWSQRRQAEDPYALTPYFVDIGTALVALVGCIVVVVYEPGRGFDYTGVVGFLALCLITLFLRAVYRWAEKKPESRFANNVATACGATVAGAVALLVLATCVR
jgi:hypothetical protein